MAKYSYAPVSVDKNKRNLPHDAMADRERDDDLVNKRLPMCVGICVLLAIIYVLSRTGDSQNPAMMDPNRGVHGTSNQEHSSFRGSTDNSSPVPSPVRSTSSVYESNNFKTKSATTTTHHASIYDETSDDNEDIVTTSTSTTKKHSIYDDDEDVGTTTTTTATTKKHSIYDDEDEEDDSTATTYTGSSSSSSSTGCPEDVRLNDSELLGKLRQKALDSTPPHIIECAEAEAGESQAACHLPKKTRYAALKQKGATLWMTGCSGAGKTTIATALEDILVKQYGKHVYRLDGDNLRTGLNRDLSFSEMDRAESVRRTGELATLFSDAGVITLVGLISPYRSDRDAVRKRHEEQNIPFYEVFLDVPVDELKKRDPKGQYAKVESGELRHFTCIDDPYEEPLKPEITLKTHELQIEESAQILFNTLERDGILIGPPKVSPPGLPNPDGDEIIDLHVLPEDREIKKEEALSLPRVLLTDIDLNWLQVIGEGWASPLKGFMREGTLLETLHFNSILVDPFNLTDNSGRLESTTNFNTFSKHQPPNRVSMSIPITLSCSSYTKSVIENSGSSKVALSTQMGHVVAILNNPEIYENRKEEIITRMYGVIDPDHPYIKHISMGGEYLIGGEIELLDRIKYNDGLDEYRLTATELMAEFERKGADTVYAFQTRNPTHAGHAYLMRSAGEDLRSNGYKNPVLWLSPLGGWTKDDDVPLDVRVKQHVEVLKAGTTHPGGLDPDSTVMAIWPAPMVYAGPTEVMFHAKSRRSAGASFFVVGRDPAGMKGSPNAVAHPDDDLYNGDHGRYVLQNSPGIGDMQMLSFVKVMYDTTDNVMKIPDESRMDDFISISGSKMRALARNGATLCSKSDIPTDLLAANCVPQGFMVPKGWDGVVDYYKHADETNRWIPWSRPYVHAPYDKSTSKTNGKQFGTIEFELHHKDEGVSYWHDIPIRPNPDDEKVINLITEIPMFMTAKMEVQKAIKGNPISQDTNKDGSPRYYTYGTPFFNYGLIPQTWEDPRVKSTAGDYGGDNDPIDAIELGSEPLAMGSITPCRVLGELELIDEGETDHKILCIALSDPDASKVHDLDDLEAIKPGIVAKLMDWLKRYKTTDGKPENTLAREHPKTIKQSLDVIQETHERWLSLCGKDSTPLSSLSSKAQDFELHSPSCRIH